MEIYKTICKCRVCGSTDLTEVLKIKEQYLAATFVKDNESHPMSKVKAPMTLMLCRNCSLVQLKETVNPDLLYHNYFYRTSINETMKNDLQELVESTLKRVELKPFDVVIDIGANDGGMLSMFPPSSRRIGVDPAKNIDWSKLDKSITIVNDYFTKENVVPFLGNQKAKIITATACFYDMPQPNEITREIKELLHEDGMAVIQVSHLLATVKDMNWQDITFEHLEYYSLKSFSHLMWRNGLKVVDVEENFVNGGSIRLYIRHQEHSEKENHKKIYELLVREEENKLSNVETYQKLSDKIEFLSKRVNEVVREEIANGGKVFGLAASTKGNVIIQVCDLTKDIFPFISDRNPSKVGLKTLGTDILLISEEEARKLKPSMMLVLTFHFKKEIEEREKEYITNGGKLLYVMPDLYYVDKDGEHKL